MTQQKDIVGKFKKWMGMDSALDVASDNAQKDTLDGTEQVLARKNGSSKRNHRDQLKQRVTEQSVLIGELTEKLIDTEIKLKGSSLQSQHLAAQNIVKTHMASGGAMALLPLPIFDFASLAVTQLSLVRKLAAHYGVDFDEATAKAVLVSLFSGVIPLVTVVGLSSVAKIIPGIGSVGGGIGMSVLSGAIIYAVGQVFIKHFEQGGTLKDFESKQWVETFKQNFEKHKALSQ